MVSPLCLRMGRETQDHKPLEQKKASGIKWALASSVAILATLVLAVCTVASVVLAGFAFASGGGALAGVFQLGGAILTAISTASVAMIAKECIKNAHYHLKKA